MFGVKMYNVFLEQQISILEWFLRDHVKKTGEMAAEKFITFLIFLQFFVSICIK